MFKLTYYEINSDLGASFKSLSDSYWKTIQNLKITKTQM